MRTIRIFNLLVIALFFSLTILSCRGQVSPKLEARVLSYVKVANDLNKIKPFLTPFVQESVPEGGIQSLAMAGIPTEFLRQPSETLQKITSADITLRIKGKWAEATIHLPTPAGTQDIKTIWLKEGGEWYLFTGSGGEIEKYGKPPIFI